VKLDKLANKILSACVKNYYNTGQTSLCAQDIVSWFPDQNVEMIYSAIRLLGRNKRLNVSYADNNPNEIQLLETTIQEYDHDTLLKKSLSAAKIIKELLD